MFGDFTTNHTGKGCETQPLRIFFAVSRGSSLWGILYKHPETIVRKLAQSYGATSLVPIGGELTNGSFLAVTVYGLIKYEAPVRLPLCQISNFNLRGKTNHIIGLFIQEAEARTCLFSHGLQQGDPRWLQETNKVLRLIGDEHPTIIPSAWNGIYFPPSDP